MDFTLIILIFLKEKRKEMRNLIKEKEIHVTNMRSFAHGENLDNL